jgi:SAM-dependent methyltransferase
VLRPYIGDHVLEIGAGIGNLTSQFIPRDTYCASDVNPVYVEYLRSYAAGKPYLQVKRIDAEQEADFHGLEGSVDTVILVNVLEHVDEQRTLANLRATLASGGRAIVLVPQGPSLYSSLDEALGHRVRYTRATLTDALQRAGLNIETLFDFNRVSVPGWWFNGKVLKRKTFSRVQLKLFDLAVPIIRHVDRLLPYEGQSLIAVARRV